MPYAQIRHAAHNAIVTRAGSQVIPKTIFASAFSACVSHYIQDMRVNRYTVQLWIKIHDQIARRGVLRCARKIPLGQLDAMSSREIEILGRITKPRQFRSNHVDHFRIGYIAHWNVGSVRFADIVPDTRNFAIANLFTVDLARWFSLIRILAKNKAIHIVGIIYFVPAAFLRRQKRVMKVVTDHHHGDCLHVRRDDLRVDVHIAPLGFNLRRPACRNAFAEL